MTADRPAPPDTYTFPPRLRVLPEYIAAQAVQNAAAFTDGDGQRAQEIVRRVLAPLGLTTSDMPTTPVYAYPDGSRTDVPLGAATAHACGWGYLTREGEIRMCTLSEPIPPDGAAPGHDTPGEHLAETEGDWDMSFEERDPRAFHAPTWLGQTDRPHEIRTDLL